MRHITVPRLPLAFALLVAACGGTRIHAPAQSDSGRDGAPDTSPPVSPAEASPDASDTSSAATCATGLSGASPFGKALAGTAAFSPVYTTAAAITATITAYIYFPAGRVLGGPVQLAMQSPAVAGQYFFGPQRTLASDLSATGLSVSGHDMTVSGDLLPGDDGLQATVHKNFASPGTDVGDTRSAAMTMCPTGDTPAPALQVLGGIASPLSTFSLNSTTPIATADLTAVQISSPWGVAPVKITANSGSSFMGGSGPNYVVTASTAFPPGQPLTFATSGLHDVIGRNVPATVEETQILATTGVLADLTFATAPPEGAAACSACTSSTFSGLDGTAPTGMAKCMGGCTVANGMLTVKPGFVGRTIDALLALPANATATKLRVRLAVGDQPTSGSGCYNGTMYSTILSGVMAVIGPNGESSERVTLACDGAMADHIINLPAASPLWLVVHLEGATSQPYYSPSPGLPPVNVDELEFM